MVRRNSGVILRQINSLLRAGTFNGLSDGQLLERFLSGHDESAELAFTLLLERHGPMVLGVCRRILADPHDAEDAFQATFLVLVRKAASVRVEGSIGRWLFGVATRSRADIRRRRNREHVALDRLEIAAVEASFTALDQAELQVILAQEIARLPERLQAPVILCDLEGSSDLEAARRLGWPVGTVKSRLSRARARLRGRLIRRGFSPSELAITVPLLPAIVPHHLVEATTQAAQSLIAGRLTTAGIVSASVAHLTQGVLRTMYWTKLKLAMAATLVLIGGSALVLSPAAGQKQSSPGETGPLPVNRASHASSGDELDLRMIESAWAEAIGRGDASLVGRILADEFEGIDLSGSLFTKASYLPDIEKGVFKEQRVEVGDIKTRIYGETAVVTSRFWLVTTPKWGRMTHVFVKRQNRWQCVASHASWSTGAGCPVVGTEADRNVLGTALKETRSASPRTNASANNCAVCHALPHQRDLEPPRPRDAAPATVPPKADGPAMASRGIRVEIDGRGDITIGGKPVAAEEDALREQLGIARRRTGLVELNLFAAETAPLQRVSIILTAAKHAGIEHFSVHPLSETAIPAKLGETTQVRTPFDCRVEKVLVRIGQTVKKGNPLLALMSIELHAAKLDYKTALSDVERAQERLRWSREMHGKGFASADQFHHDQNAEDRCKLQVLRAEEKLRSYGLTEEEIKSTTGEKDEDLGRFTLRSPAEGRITRIAAELGPHYNNKTGLIIIEPTTAARPPAQ